MRRAILFATLVTVTAALNTVRIDAQTKVHRGTRFDSLSFLPPEWANPKPVVPPSDVTTALAQLTAQKIDALTPPPGIDCKMAREASQGIDPGMRKPGTSPGGPSFSGRIIPAPSRAKR